MEDLLRIPRELVRETLERLETDPGGDDPFADHLREIIARHDGTHEAPEAQRT